MGQQKSQLDSLRRVIREEVRAVFQEELASILKEAIVANRQPIVENRVSAPAAKPTVPGTLNTQPVRKMAAPILSPGNPLNNLLAETAMSMSDDDTEAFSFSSGDAMGFGGQTMMREAPVVNSVDQMLASARPSSNMDAIQINAVPDFTALMNKMQQTGQI
jgi:hypothetical protein